MEAVRKSCNMLIQNQKEPLISSIDIPSGPRVNMNTHGFNADITSDFT